jgi:hypothetical protein
MRLLLGILAILGATCLYAKGETETKLLGKSNKWYKTLMGIPIALCLLPYNFPYSLLCMVTYFIALQFGYGVNNWTVKLFGKMGAIIFCGALMGIASIPVLGWWAILQTIISGYTFYWLEKKNDTIHEPWVAIIRGVGGTICLL